VEEVQQILASSPKVKVVGSGHTFNHISDTKGVQICMKNFRGVEVDGYKAKFGAGLPYADLIAGVDK